MSGRWRVGRCDPKIVREQPGDLPDRRHVDDGGDDSIAFFRHADHAALAVRAVNALMSRADQDARESYRLTSAADLVEVQLVARRALRVQQDAAPVGAGDPLHVVIGWIMTGEAT